MAGGGDTAQYRAFTDTWRWDDAAEQRLEGFEGVARPAYPAIAGFKTMLGRCGMLAYLTYMAERLEQCRRLLKLTGSIYLHCDPTASHYLKCIMDQIFDAPNYMNEVSWLRSPPKNDDLQGAMNWPRNRDIILHYRASAAYDRFTQPVVPLKNAEKQYDKTEPGTGRRYQLTSLTAPGAGTRGHPEYEFMGVTRFWRYNRQKMEELAEQGRIVQTKPGNVPRYKRYLDESRGATVGEQWSDIAPVQGSSKEFLKYPTQKPTKLLRRIIAASTNEGDLVLDPFCGCGTTAAAASELGRAFIGIDISSHAIDVIVQEKFGGDKSIPQYGIPADLRSAERLADNDPIAFQTWAIDRLFGFAPNTKHGADGGIDGIGKLAEKPSDWTSRLALAQATGMKAHSATKLRDFCHVTNRDNAAVGCYITLHQVNTDAARTEAAAMRHITVRGQTYKRMHLWSIQDFFDDRLPSLPPMLNPYTGKQSGQMVLR